jgi:hypothetical protein
MALLYERRKARGERQEGLTVCTAGEEEGHDDGGVIAKGAGLDLLFCSGLLS